MVICLAHPGSPRKRAIKWVCAHVLAVLARIPSLKVEDFVFICPNANYKYISYKTLVLFSASYVS